MQTEKIIDQMVLSTSLLRNMPRAIFYLSCDPTPFLPDEKAAAMPMSAKSVVQTGPNTHAGGLRAGFTIPAYTSNGWCGKHRANNTPTSSETTIAMMSLNVV